MCIEPVSSTKLVDAQTNVESKKAKAAFKHSFVLIFLFHVSVM